MKKLAAISAILLLTACVHQKETWVRNYEGQQLEVASGHIGDEVKNEKFVTITNTNREWVAGYKGGEEMVQARKNFLLVLAVQESQQLCKNKTAVADGEPDYEMMDRSPMIFGGGLLGYAIAAAASDYANLPTAIRYNFKCTESPVANTGVQQYAPVYTAPSAAPVTSDPAAQQQYYQPVQPQPQVQQ